jgi:hypothetical protein
MLVLVLPGNRVPLTGETVLIPLKVLTMSLIIAFVSNAILRLIPI